LDLALASGATHLSVGRRFGIAHNAVSRHSANHLTPDIRAALKTKLLKREEDLQRVLLEEGAGIVEALSAIRGPLYGLYLAAIDVGDAAAAARFSGRLHESLTISAKVTGDLVPHVGTSITNVVLSPDYQLLRHKLLRILERHPAAKAEVEAEFRAASQAAAAEMRRTTGRAAPLMIEAEAAD
jgi:hypothetical protein